MFDSPGFYRPGGGPLKITRKLQKQAKNQKLPLKIKLGLSEPPQWNNGTNGVWENM